jgi:glutathione S-transferase
LSYKLFAHPFSSYSWKAMIALHEKELPFELRIVESSDAMAELRDYWPLGKFPVLIDDSHQPGKPLIEATTIIEYLDLRHYERAPLIPATASDALEVRFLDRVFDNHVMTPMQAVVNEALPNVVGTSDPARAAHARDKLETIYAWLEHHLAGRTWAAGQGFSLADCAAAPSLFYADWVHPIGSQYPDLRAYRTRLNARRSVSRCIEGARPYRHYFPLGAPDRD